MKKRIILAAVMALFCVALAAYGRSKHHGSLPDSRPKDFTLTFKYGMGGDSVLDTANGTLAVGCVTGPVPFTLSKADLDTIYAKIVKIGFFDFPNGYVPRQVGSRRFLVAPHPSYSIRVRCAGKLKTLSWEDESDGRGRYDSQASQLYEVIQLLQKIIEKKPAYKYLPPPSCAYL